MKKLFKALKRSNRLMKRMRKVQEQEMDLTARFLRVGKSDPRG